MNSPIKNEYSIREKFQLGWWLLKTKLLNPKARLIRFPFTIRGGGYIDLGKGLTTGVGCRLEAFRMNDDRHKRIIFGNNIQMNDYVHISAIEKVEIGSNVLIWQVIYTYPTILMVFTRALQKILRHGFLLKSAPT